MIRILIDWNFISPSLETASGIASVHYVEELNNWILLCQFKVKVERGCTSYKSIDEKGFPAKIFDAIKPQLDVMVKCYRDGLILSKNSCCWLLSDDLTKAKKDFDDIEENKGGFNSTSELIKDKKMSYTERE